MAYLDVLCNFSRTHCVALCAVLVPLNLLLTVQTIYSVGTHRSSKRVCFSAGLVGLTAAILVFHVTTWWAVGVVAPSTYILLGIACLCLSLNGWAVGYPPSMLQVLTMLKP